MTIEKTINQIKKFDFQKELLNIVSSNDQIALDLNRDVQLFDEGSDSKGNLLTPPYAELTVFLKGLAGQPTNRVTLKDTGDFHESFFMDASKFPVRIDATDPKTGGLKEDYGEDIFGLDEESQEEFNKKILPEVQEAYRRALGIL